MVWDGKTPFVYRSAMNYYMASKSAAGMTFVELFNDIGKYIDDDMDKFQLVTRVKRGVEDTSKPGGYYKDQVYLEGVVRILQERKKIDFKGLMAGKLSLEDIKKPHVQKLVNKDAIVLPPIMKDMDRYMEALDRIAQVNHVPAI